MRHLGAQEAADAIRTVVVQDQSARFDPAHARRLNFVRDVCAWLGLDPTIENITHVGVVLREHDIALHEAHEYPKYVTREDGSAHIVNSEAEEHETLRPTVPVEPSGEFEKLGGDTDAHRASMKEPFPSDVPVDPQPEPDVQADPEPAPRLKNKRPV